MNSVWCMMQGTQSWCDNLEGYTREGDGKGFQDGGDICMHTCVLSHFSWVWLFATPWTVVHQVLLSMGFSRQENWSGLPVPFSRELPHGGSNPVTLMSPELAVGFFTISTTWEAPGYLWIHTDVWQKPSQYCKVIILQLK